MTKTIRGLIKEILAGGDELTVDQILEKLTVDIDKDSLEETLVRMLTEEQVSYSDNFLWTILR